ncbi:hypothetical protein K402DRAFT_5908 [Aulographum hederae CBS 113979]|uniref:Uncharacterized protein n=1 Tax=Aulographum hederae CBS 113979 TaxID=1176131 RepID=A0A6G1HHA5_9PEZI|nr:hypothetical protein K402DRAFT_5908 [Aulographum hederae CBS 113979]
MESQTYLRLSCDPPRRSRDLLFALPSSFALPGSSLTYLKVATKLPVYINVVTFQTDNPLSP